eukprot:3356539-Heterocapsa_arctica.AAC.1
MTSPSSKFSRTLVGHLALLALATRAGAQVRLQRTRSAPSCVRMNTWLSCFHARPRASGASTR